jgi:anti-sigma B factor antagonist
MNIKESVHGDVIAITPKGSLLGDEETASLRERIHSAVNEGYLKVVLDVGNITWINSSGLGTLISALGTLNRAGGDLRIANVTDKIQSLFLITQLFKVFKTYETTERAVGSFVTDPISGKTE